MVERPHGNPLRSEGGGVGCKGQQARRFVTTAREASKKIGTTMKDRIKELEAQARQEIARHTAAVDRLYRLYILNVGGCRVPKYD